MPCKKEEDEVNIFEDQEDYYQFLKTLDMMALSYEPDGTPSGRNYILYAYCLMTNHIHLLIREREDKIGMAIKSIHQNPVKAGMVAEVNVNEPLSDDIVCLEDVV